MAGHDCPSCERTFETPQGLGSHHSRKHGERLGSPTAEVLTCAACGDEYEETPSRVARSNYCSADCRHDALSQRTGEAHPLSAKETLVCKTCGDEYEEIPSRVDRSNYCSRECADTGKSLHWAGPNSPLWGGGPLYHTVRDALAKRSWVSVRNDAKEDVCESCGTPPGERDLDVHHIVPILAGGTNEPYNLMTLCRACHISAERYTEGFTDRHLTPGVEVGSETGEAPPDEDEADVPAVPGVPPDPSDPAAPDPDDPAAIPPEDGGESAVDREQFDERDSVPSPGDA